MKGFRSNPAKSASSSAVDTLIGRQTEILGGVRFAGVLHVDGRFKGAYPLRLTSLRHCGSVSPAR